MFCKNCGAELKGNARFCEKCGTKLEEGIRVQNYRKKILTKLLNSKKIIIISSSILLVIISTVIIFNLNKTDYTDYLDVLQLCCDAINEKDEGILDNIVYEGLGDDWNKEYIYNTIDMFYKEQELSDETYLPLTTVVDDYKHYKSSSDIEKLQEWIHEETGAIVNIEEGYELEMDNESCIEIFLIRITNRWYVLYLDL